MISPEDVARLAAGVRQRVQDVGYDGSLLEGGDLLLTIDPDGRLMRDADGEAEVRICNFELIARP